MRKKETEKMVDSGLEFLKALNLVTEEKGISKDLIIEAMKQALMTAYKKNYDSRTNVRVDFDELTGKFKVISYYIVVDDYIDSTYETDEEGNEVKFEFLDLVELDEEEYVVLLPVSEEGEEDEGEVVILKLEDTDEDSEEESYVGVEDEDILNKVFAIFKEKYKDEFNFVDEN